MSNSPEISLSLKGVASCVPSLIGTSQILNADESFQWLATHERLIGWTFTVTSRWLAARFTRLIVGKPKPGAKYPTNIRLANNVHIKCYIDSRSMLIGSFNLIHPTIEDCCVIVTRRSDIAHMKRQFEKHWQALK